jgi:hypothetical protein
MRAAGLTRWRTSDQDIVDLAHEARRSFAYRIPIDKFGEAT